MSGCPDSGAAGEIMGLWSGLGKMMDVPVCPLFAPFLGFAGCPIGGGPDIAIWLISGVCRPFVEFMGVPD